MELTLEGSSGIREKIEAKNRELGVQVLLDIDPSKSLDKKENIYRQTLEFLESLNDEEKLKLKKEGDFVVEDLSSLNEIKSKIGRKEGESKFSPEQIDKELLEKLNAAGIKVEIVEALMNLAMYDENEKTLKIRQDADAEHVNDYIKDIVFREPDEVGSPTENGEPFVEQHFDYDKKDKDEGDNEGESGIGEEPQPQPQPEVKPEPEITPPNPLLQQEGGPAVTKLSPEPLEPQPEKIPTNEEEWEEFVKLRNDLAKTEAKKGNFSNETGVSIEDLKSKYASDKEKIAGLIRKEQHKTLGEGPLTEEQERSLNDYLFEELVKKENDEYLNALKANRKETWKDKTIETAKNLLGTKAVKWYLSLSRSQRMALSFGVGSIAGLAAGATVAPGIIGLASYLGWRAARVGLSGTAGATAGEWANKKWSAEELKKAEEKETEDLKNSQLSLEEKSKGLLDIEKRYKKERIKMTLKKMGTTVAAGAGTGFLTGLAEHVVMGMGGATQTAVESRGGRGGNIQENKLPTRKGFEPQTKPKASSVTEQTQPTKPSVSEQTPTPKAPVAPKPPEPVIPSTEKIFDKPEVLIHEVKAGDSTWKILEKTLENNEQFKGMTEAQKTYVLSTLTNKALQDPAKYGLGNEGTLHIGDKTDFTKLFEDTKEVKSILDKAGKTIIKDSLQEKSILANNKSIATWVSDPSNKGKILDESKVSEILATKPKVEITPESSLAPEFPNPEPLPQDIPSGPPPIPDGEIVLAGGIAMAGAATLNSVDQYRKKRDEEQIRRDIAIAEGRLAELEEKEARNPGLRSLADDSKNIQDLQNTNRFSHAIVEAFEKTIDRIYGKKGVIGWGKVNGIKTKEWLEMDRFTAKEPVQYIKGESERGKLSQKFLKIAESPKNQKFIKELGDLMNQTEWKVEPREREKPSEFVMRLVEFITNKRSQLPNLKRAA